MVLLPLLCLRFTVNLGNGTGQSGQDPPGIMQYRHTHMRAFSCVTIPTALTPWVTENPVSQQPRPTDSIV